MLLHAKYAAGQCQEAKIVIQSPDTDVLVLSAAHFEDIASKELWFRTGVKDRLRFVPVHDVCQNLSNRTADELRYIIFCQKKPNSEALPPTSDSLRQHINRANYQTHIWRKSLDALLELPSP
ncbi:unnamed protein product, partial [Porites evermanni]